MAGDGAERDLWADHGVFGDADFVVEVGWLLEARVLLGGGDFDGVIVPVKE